MKVSDSDGQWHALLVRPRFEQLVATNLERKGHWAYLPLYRLGQRRITNPETIALPLFPGYVFCKFDRRDRVQILLTAGVISIVTLGDDGARYRKRRFWRYKASWNRRWITAHIVTLMRGKWFEFSPVPCSGWKAMLWKRMTPSS